jgi:hypothetical protein
MIWPFQPADTMLEGVEHVTDALRAFSQEQRIQLVGAPRRRLNHEYVFSSPRAYERARLMMRGTHPDAFEVPDWSSFPRIATAAAGATSLTFDNTSPEFTSSMNLAIWQDEETFEALDVTSSTTGGLTLSTPLVEDYPEGHVLRLLECDSQTGLDAMHPAGPHRTGQVEWLCYTDTAATEDASGLGTYRGDYLLTDCPEVGEVAVPEYVRHLFNTVDNGIARPFRDTALEHPSETLGLAWQPLTRAASWALRRKLLALRGRQKAFWVPTFNNALELTATATSGSSTVVVRKIGLQIGFPDDAMDIFFRLTSGTTIARQVTGIAVGATTETLTLASTRTGSNGCIGRSSGRKWSWPRRRRPCRHDLRRPRSQRTTRRAGRALRVLSRERDAVLHLGGRGRGARQQHLHERIDRAHGDRTLGGGAAQRHHA